MSKRCDQCDDADEGYCWKCGEPHGALREMLLQEASEQLDGVPRPEASL